MVSGTSGTRPTKRKDNFVQRFKNKNKKRFQALASTETKLNFHSVLNTSGDCNLGRIALGIWRLFKNTVLDSIEELEDDLIHKELAKYRAEIDSFQME